MAVEPGSELVRHARELERQDRDLAARIEAVVVLLTRVDAARHDAQRVREVLAALPDAVAVAERSEHDARVRESEAQTALADAEHRSEELSRSRRASEEQKAEVERTLRRATVAAADATENLARMRARIEELAAEEVALRAEAEGLAVVAGVVATEVAEVPRLSESGRTRPGGSLAEIEQWGARLHAALFVVRGGLENEREKVVLEAHALGAAALGEQLGGASVELVRRRLEESLARP